MVKAELLPSGIADGRNIQREIMLTKSYLDRENWTGSIRVLYQYSVQEGFSFVQTIFKDILRPL